MPRVEAYGTVDELNSVIGMLLAEEVQLEIRSCLTRVQHELLGPRRRALHPRLYAPSPPNT